MWSDLYLFGCIMYFMFIGFVFYVEGIVVEKFFNYCEGWCFDLR